IALADDDHDGDADIYVDDWLGADSVLRLANEGGGAFGAPAYALPAGLPFLGRFDADGFDDVLLFPKSLPGLVIAAGQAAGGFFAPGRFGAGLAGNGL